jgi:hypothetical protein
MKEKPLHRFVSSEMDSAEGFISALDGKPDQLLGNYSWFEFRITTYQSTDYFIHGMPFVLIKLINFAE